MKKVVIIISVIFSIVLFTLCGYFFIFSKEDVVVLLNGNNNVTLNIFDTYNDQGIIVKVNNNVIDNTKYTIKIDNKVDTNNVGNYQIIYDVTYKKDNIKLQRDINVIDNINPEITLDSEEAVMDYCTKKLKKEVTFKAIDNYDGDITSQVEVITNDDNITYKVADSSGNIDEKVISIKYESKPKNQFTLKGKKKMNVLLNGTFTDPGATYKDGCGNGIEKEITVSGTVDTSEIGTYFITYSVDGENDLTREVVVFEKVVQPKTIYLTFDDGPGSQTSKILDTLDKYNVKATFFVTHQFSSYMHLIGEEHQRGHSVAVHTYTHDYKTVYSSVDGYVNDFNRMNEVIKSYTGSYSKIFRFPGGSSNTVSKKYGSGIVTKIAKEMLNMGYYYFDWNVDSQDAAGANSSKVYNQVVNGVEKCTNCVVLMHDIKSATANALDDILKTLTEKGYTFKVLTTSSPAIRHHINN